MAEDEDRPDATPDETTGAQPSEPTPPARPQSAASRARRIGGGASPAASAASSGPARPTPAPRAEPVDIEKVARTRTEKSEAPRRRLRLSLPGWTAWTPAIAFAAVAVVFLTLFLVARLGGSDNPGRSQAERTRVLAAAKTCVAALNTYRYDQLTAAEAAGVKCTTGKLTSDFKKTMTTIIMKNAPTLKAVQQAKITTAGVESVTANGKQWTVLAYGSLSITTAQQKQGRDDPFAVIVRLEQSGGRWVLSKVDTVSSFNP